MILEAKDIIEEYFETIKDKYSDFEKVNITCRYPFKFVKEKITEGKFKDIRLKYFGTFKVYPSFIIELWYTTNTLQFLSDEKKEENRKRIITYVQEHEDLFKKYKTFKREIENYINK
jgi:adenylate kinase family enzyme